MSLRMRILLFLFLFGPVPLMLAGVINLPLVLERVDLLPSLLPAEPARDFSDLDQHLASRDASVRLAVKLPEPGALVGNGGGGDRARSTGARPLYTVINRILGDERDITEILFLGERNGIERFWLERESGSGKWQPTTRRLRGVPPDQSRCCCPGVEQRGAQPAHRSDRRRIRPVFTLPCSARRLGDCR